MIPILEFRNKRIRKPFKPTNFNKYAGIKEHILNQLSNGQVQIRIPTLHAQYLTKYASFFRIIHFESGTTNLLMHESIEDPPIDEWSRELVEMYSRIIEINIYNISIRIQRNEAVTLNYLHYQNFMDVIYTYFVDTHSKDDVFLRRLEDLNNNLENPFTQAHMSQN